MTAQAPMSGEIARKTMKLGTNRGNPRLWLEGSVLHNAGFNRGVPYDVTIGTAAIVLKVNYDGGKRRVSGKTVKGNDHAIIDMNGANLSAFANVELTLTSHNGLIVLSKEV